MTKNQHTDIGGFVRQREQNYASGTPTQLSAHVDFSLKDHVEHVEAYKFSKHISGSVDSKGREKPFPNIGTSISNVWYRATDIDRRNIRVKATKQQDMVAAFAATHKLQEFMRKEDFGTFLNKWGRVLADYGSAVTKFVEKDGKLHCRVVPWTNLIVDPVNFDSDVTIELLELTADQLLQRDGYDREMVEKLIDARESREDLDGTDKDTQNDDFIRLFEVHGKMPKSFRTGNEEDRFVYEQQMYVISFVEKKDGDLEDFILASGREDKHPYMITHLIEEENRVMGVGSYELIFDAQWMRNHISKAIKDQLDLASKLVFQTSDDTFIGQNALIGIETGDFLIHAENKPLTQLANNSHDISALQAYGAEWDNLAKELTSTPDAIRGDTMPSGTAYRSVAIQNRESHSLFELMTENKGLAIERMMRTYILPYLKKQLKTDKEMAVVLENNGIQFLDPRFIKYEAAKRNKKAVKDILLNGSIDELPSLDPAAPEADIQAELNSLGNQRFLKPSEIPGKTWAEVLENLEWDLEVEVTNENSDKEVTMTTLTTVLQTIAANPAILQDKNASLLFNKILEETGRVSPIELSASNSIAQPTPEVAELAPQTPS